MTLTKHTNRFHQPLYIATQKIHNTVYTTQAPTREEAIENIIKEIERQSTPIFCHICNRMYSPDEIDPCDIPY